ncbi:MAG: ABC transporter ATP-binding protein [Acidobacteriota bacterium]
MTDRWTGAALEARGLTKSFAGHLSLGRTPVLKGLDLTVHQGEIYGFIGANGAGKTTTIKIVTGLIRADAGRFELFGCPGREPRARRRLGFLPEQPVFYAHLTGREFLDLHARLLRLRASERRREVDRRLDEVGMLSRAAMTLRRCSKGMLQRIGIAQALLGDPDLLILDEPMSGLDPSGRRDIRDLILAQRDRKATIFFSSHILSDAEVLCDRVGILREGRLALEGTLEELLVQGDPTWEVAVSGIGHLGECQGVQVSSRHGDRVLLRVHGEPSLAALLEHTRKAGGVLHSVMPYRYSLEERFLDVVGSEERPR